MASNKLKNLFKPQGKQPKFVRAGDAGFDNARENIDPHIKTKVVSTQEGSIERAPTNSNHITNKAYVDGLTDIKLIDNSIANDLHRHSELVASDGSPDPALSVNTLGIITMPSQPIVYITADATAQVIPNNTERRIEFNTEWCRMLRDKAMEKLKKKTMAQFQVSRVPRGIHAQIITNEENKIIERLSREAYPTNVNTLEELELWKKNIIDKWTRGSKIFRKFLKRRKKREYKTLLKDFPELRELSETISLHLFKLVEQFLISIEELDGI